jgi:hypothetical protein
LPGEKAGPSGNNSQAALAIGLGLQSRPHSAAAAATLTNSPLGKLSGVSPRHLQRAYTQKGSSEHVNVQFGLKFRLSLIVRAIVKVIDKV